MRLSGYAYLYARPDTQKLPALVESVTNEDRPFGQYWGLQSIAHVLPQAVPHVPSSVKAKLRAFAADVPPGSDRDYEVRKLLRQLDRSTPSD